MTTTEKTGLMLMLLGASFLLSTEGVIFLLPLGIWGVGVLMFFAGGRKT